MCAQFKIKYCLKIVYIDYFIFTTTISSLSPFIPISFLYLFNSLKIKSLKRLPPAELRTMTWKRKLQLGYKMPASAKIKCLVNFQEHTCCIYVDRLSQIISVTHGLISHNSDFIGSLIQATLTLHHLSHPVSVIQCDCNPARCLSALPWATIIAWASEQQRWISQGYLCPISHNRRREQNMWQHLNKVSFESHTHPIFLSKEGSEKTGTPACPTQPHLKSR